jgi:uncharacterized protein (DUF2267 family)
MLQTHNQSQAMLGSVLHNVRRRMTTEQVLTFADALPPSPRGIFIEGWRPTDPPPIGSANEFLQEVVQDLSPRHVPPDSIVTDAFAKSTASWRASRVPTRSANEFVRCMTDLGGV